MALVKARLGGVPVLFNPTQYSLDAGNLIAEISVPGLGAPVLQFVRGNARTISLELFLDTYEQRRPVTVHTDAIYRLLAIDQNTHAPPVTTFEWGRFSFRCVVERVSGRFTLFLEDGAPVRATVTVALKEFVDLEQAGRGIDPHSADHYKSRVVERGETLSAIADDEYGDPGAWRPIALANRITNPRKVEAGRSLVIPPLAPDGAAG